MTATEPLDLLPPGSAVDLSNCAREPIHLPGAVQPHGVLLVVRIADRTVVQASDNTEEVLGTDVQQVLGADLSAVVGPDAASTLMRMGPPGSPPQSGSVLVDDRPFDALTYLPEPGYLAVELEPLTGGAQVVEPADGLDARWLLDGLRTADDLEELLAVASRLLREVTGYERVWAYRFERDGHGVVVAEAKSERLASLLGHHFPEGDIPAQARALYLRNGVRTIVDALAAPARLVPVVNPDTDRWTDMSDSALRAVSPMHIAYLDEMGVRASASVALVVDGRLWGLLAAHHYDAARRLGRQARVLSGLLGTLVGIQIDALGRAAESTGLLALQQHQRRVLEEVATARTVAEGLVADPAALLGACRATGAVVRVGAEVLLVGRTPPQSRCEALLDALLEPEELADAGIVALDSVAATLPAFADIADTAAGVLATTLSRRHGNALLWLRPEQQQEVTWGGQVPPVTVGADQAARLTPRGSYESWKQTVRLTCRPWLLEERRSAQQLRSSLGTLLLSHAEALARANDELVRANAELDAFTYSAAHDLREPLRGMNSLATFLLEDYGELLGDVGRDRLQRIIVQARRMATLLDSLLDYATLGRAELAVQDVSVATAADQAGEVLRRRFEQTGGELRHGPDGTVRADPTRLLEVLTNLIDNALKYTRGPHPVVEVGVMPLAATRRGRAVLGEDDNPFADAPEPHVVYVSDRGIGIPQQEQEVVFRVFHRLHDREAFGGGSGAGLAIVRRIVERHGGRIWVEDNPGGGTKMCFTLQP